MAEVQANPTALQPGNAAAAPQGNQQQSSVSSQPQIDHNEYNSLKTQVEQYKRAAEAGNGYKPFYETSRKHGLTDPKQLDELGSLYATINKHGLSAKQVTQMFASDLAEKSDDPGTVSKAEMERMFGERFSKFEADNIRKQAEAQHKAALDADCVAFGPTKIRAIKGLEDSDDDVAQLLADAAENRYWKSLKPYGDDSPLKGQFQPGGSQALESAFGGVKSAWDKHVAAKTLAIGKAARTSGQSTTPVGQSGGQGKPEAQTAGSGGNKRERLQAAADAVMAARKR